MRALHVRLPNHLGDACMCVPALDLLDSRFVLTLVGKPWARSLFEAYDRPVVPLTGSWWSQRASLSHSIAGNPGDANALLFTNSFGSALQLRLAGMRPRGYATEARAVLLDRAVPLPARWAADMHTVEYYLELVSRAFDLPIVSPPAELNLRIGEAARTRARAQLDAAGVAAPYVVLCPVAVGLHRGKVKAWDGFGRLSRVLRERGVNVVAMPGPGELDAVRTAVPDATLLPGSDVATFAALLAGSRLVVANDSGPGHVAAAVGARLVSVFGVTDPLKTRPWGSRATLLGGAGGWPDYGGVESTVLAALA